MLAWLEQNWGNIVILAVIALVVGAIVVFHIRAKRKGKNTCGGGCAGCAMEGMCHSHTQKKK